MNLADIVEIEYGLRSAAAVRDCFNALALPLPAAGYYTRTYGYGYLLLLETPGIAIHLVNNWKYPQIKSPDVLQPIASRLAGRLRIDVSPGLRLPENLALFQHDSGVDKVAASLQRQGYHFWDAATRNCGILPPRPGDIRERLVVIDKDAVRQLHFNVQTIKRWIGYAPPPSFPEQDAVFGGLKEKFNQAWPQSRAHADPRAMLAFWDACIAEKEQGTLVTGWRDFYRGHGTMENLEQYDQEAQRYQAAQRKRLSLPAP